MEAETGAVAVASTNLTESSWTFCEFSEL